MKNNPAPLLIQEELVDEGKDIKDTSAGEAVDGELSAKLKHHEAEIATLREETRQALEEKDEFMKKHLEEESRKLEAKMERMKIEKQTMEAKFDEERKRMGEEMGRMQGGGGCIVI